MSTPQLEDGFVRIANELMEAILRGGFSQRELLVLLTVLRKTYGYGKKEDDMSASQIGDLCKLARPHVTATLNQLAQRNVISKRQGRFGSIVGVQKDHRKWISAEQTAPASTDLVQGGTDSVHVPDQYATSTESVQVASTDSVHTKDNLQKENHQKKKSCAPKADRDQVGETPAGHKGRAKTGSAELQDRFDRFYEAYPRKKSRGTAEKAFGKLAPSEELLAQMLAGLERCKASGEWTDPKFIPHPASWLNAKGWLDEVQVDYAPAEREVIEAYNEVLGDRMGCVSATSFNQARAALIREFLTFSDRPELARRFFGWFATNCEAPPRAGLDWLISRRVYGDAVEGQYIRKAA